MSFVNARTLPKAILIATLALIACSTPSAAQELANLQPVTAPAYNSDRGIMRNSTEEQYNSAIADTRYAFEQFTYQSDGLTVGAYLFRPRETQGRLPVVVFNRGGWVRQDFGAETLVQAQRFNAAGFIVIAPFLRGSNGTQGRDEMGGADLNDLMNIVPIIRALPYADPERIFLYGESRGSMMSFQALRDGFPARAVATYGSWGDLSGLVQEQPQVAAHIWPDLEQNREAIIERRSAMRWIERINAPVLLMHGRLDRDVPLQYAQEIDAALGRAGKTHELRVFEGARHTLAENAAERDAAAIAWFRRFDQR